MNKNHVSSADILESQTRTIIQQGNDIKQQVRDITIEALSQGNLDVDKIKHVIRCVIKGATEGATGQGSESNTKLGDAIQGLDEALSKSIQASQLAIEEAAGRIKEFGKQDLRNAIDEISELEGLFIEVIKNVARNSDEVIKNTLNDLADHAHNSGTVVGKSASNAVTSLNQNLGKSLQDSVSSGKETALTIAANISKAAAGFLDGIAESLQPKKNPPKNKAE